MSHPLTRVPIPGNAAVAGAMLPAHCAFFVAAPFLPRGEGMRTVAAVLIFIVFLPAAFSNQERPTVPTVSADTVTIRQVRRASEIGAATEPGDSRETLLVERPVDAREGAEPSVFVVDRDG